MLLSTLSTNVRSSWLGLKQVSPFSHGKNITTLVGSSALNRIPPSFSRKQFAISSVTKFNELQLDHVGRNQNNKKVSLFINHRQFSLIAFSTGSSSQKSGVFLRPVNTTIKRNYHITNLFKRSHRNTFKNPYEEIERLWRFQVKVFFWWLTSMCILACWFIDLILLKTDSHNEHIFWYIILTPICGLIFWAFIKEPLAVIVAFSTVIGLCMLLTNGQKHLEDHKC